MALRDWFGFLAPPEFKEALSGTPAEASLRVGVQALPSYPAATGGLRAYSRNELVYACLDVKAIAAKAPRLIVQRRGPDGEWREEVGHPARRLLTRPQADMSGGTLLRAMLVSWDAARILYLEKVRSESGAVVGLNPLDPTAMRREREGYVWQSGSQRVIFDANDLYIRRAPTWSDPAPLAVALGSVDADNAQTDYVRAFFNNAGVPSGILKVKGTLEQEQADALRTKWRAKYGRQWGSQHDVAVLDDNADYQRIGANLAELDSESLRSLHESRICMAFGVPPLIVYAYVGLLRATYANLKEAWAGFWDARMLPELGDWADWLTWEILPAFEGVERVADEQVRFAWDYSQVTALRPDMDAIRKRAREDFAAGGTTLNEFRAAIGMAADPSGNYYLRPANRLPVEVGSAATPPPADPETRSAPPPAPPPAPPTRERRALPDLAPLAERMEPQLRSYLRGQFDTAITAIRALAELDLRSAPSETRKASISVSQLGLDEGDQIGLLLRALYPAPMRAAYRQAETDLDADLPFRLSNPRVQETLDQLAREARGISATTRDQIGELVVQSALEGWSTDELISRLQQLADVATAQRAALIARTETARAYTQASLLAYADSGVVSAVEWLAGPNSCPTCKNLDGVTRPLGQSFPVSFPPAHPGCTCALAPVVNRSAS